MAYAQKYLFKWESIHKVEYQIKILKDGYSGSVIQRHLGGAPILKMQQNECVKGTSLEFKAEAQVDGEFAELYTSDPLEFKVELYRGGTKIWSGFITPEIYSEPDIAPPYDVDVVATDGLGELKLFDFEPTGKKTLRTHLYNILANTGQDLEIYYISQIHVGTSISDVNFLRLVEIDLDFEEGKTCYDVLTDILNTLHATITYSRGVWFIVRETDFEISGTSVRAIAAGTRAQSDETTIANAVYSIGQMWVADMWPIGYSSTSIVPAKKKVVVEAPYHSCNGIVNGDLSSTTGWTRPLNSRSEQTSYLSNIPAFLLGPEGAPTTLYQELSLKGIPKPITLKTLASRYARSRAGGVLSFKVTFVSGSTTYYLVMQSDSDGNSVIDWTTTAPSSSYLSKALTTATSNKDEADEVELVIPVLPSSVTSGTLHIEFSGTGVYILNVDATVVVHKGYKETINIDNGARGDVDPVEIIAGVPDDVEDSLTFMEGILIYNNIAIPTFTDGNFSGDFLDITAKGYALSVALPRLSTQGHFNMPSGKTYAPILLDNGNVKLIVKTYEWDLLEEELDIEAMSLPGATMTVEDSSVNSLGPATISNTSSSPSSGGGGGGGGGAVNSIAVNSNTYNPDSNGKVTLPNYPSLTGYATEQWVTDKGYATQTWVNNKGYITQVTWSMVTDALGYAPVSPYDLAVELYEYAKIDDIAGLVVPPVIQIVRGKDHGGFTIAPRLVAFHPLIGDSRFDAEFVLMMWSNRRGRKHAINARPKYRRGWGEAKGAVATISPITFGSGADDMRRGYYPIRNIQLHILHNYVCGAEQSLSTVRAMSWSDFIAAGADGYIFGFGALNNFQGTEADFYKKAPRHRMFGIAIRVLNPAFSAAVSGVLDETTRSIEDPNNTGHYIPRYLYSAVTPFQVIIGSTDSGDTTMGFQMQPINAPHKIV